jgi:hypothetical protein
MTEIMSIPIRADVYVRFANIPHDLTKAEAGKIARVVKAFAYRPKPRDNQGRFIKTDVKST